jgi:imidazole glycerol phosphate synthase glutamine amidotransferase subunit
LITLVDFGHENHVALEGALDRLGYTHCRAADPDRAAPAGPVVLAGAGPLAQACVDLKARGWWRELPHLVAEGRPLLGVNLGLHLLAEGSEECPKGAGLGLVPGIVRRLGPGARTPHWGWTQVQACRPHPMLPDWRGGWLFFAHSYALEPCTETLAVAVHGRPFSAMECRGRTVGLQARLERSGAPGLDLLARFLEAMGAEPEPGRGN